MLRIDGSYGEAGGQLLRSSLSLSVLLEKPFNIFNIRPASEKRRKPGLQPQHLMCAGACKRITGGKMVGAEVGSRELTFTPGRIMSGDYEFDIGTAGSTALLFQALAPALAFGQSKTTLKLIGGTANPLAPTYLYLKHVWLPMLKKIGFEGEIEIERWGWYPKGGGILKANIEAIRELSPIKIIERGSLKEINGIAVLANLPQHIGEREKETVIKELGRAGIEAKINVEVQNVKSIGKGTELFLCAKYESTVAGFSSLGEIGKRAEAVALDACKDFLEFHRSPATIDSHLCDQILLYLALAKGRSTFISKITLHLLTNAWLISQFLPEAKIKVDGKEGEVGKVEIEGVGYTNKFLR